MAFEQKDPKEIQRRIEQQKAEAAKRKAAFERHKQLFDSLARFARSNGDAWISSPPGERWIRLEAELTSAVPDKLRDAGYRLAEIGAPGERIEAGRVLQIQVFQFLISG